MLVLGAGSRRRERVELAVSRSRPYRFLLRRLRPGKAIERGAGGGWRGGLMGRIDTS